MLEGIPVIGLSAPALVAITVVMLLTGLIVPRRTLMDVIRERNDWKKAYEAEREARQTSDAQTGELLEVAKTTRNIITAMFTNTEQHRRSGGTDVLPKEEE